MTRRVVKNKTALDWLSAEVGFSPLFVAHRENGLCPYGQPGDRLWTRETWAHNPRDKSFLYRATDNDGALVWADGAGHNRWKPSIHMPRAASRILLEIAGVRVERLQDISEQDAIAEGIEGRYHPAAPNLWTWRDYDSKKERFSYGTAVYPKSVFRKLWQSINGPESWAQNPWCWVVEFKRIEP
jgi:hypothetical protein